jgi:sialidase-1
MKLIYSKAIYENPIPHLRSRHGYFPGGTVLPNGDLLVVFSISEAFESTDAFPYAMRSLDAGATWTMQGPLYQKPQDACYSEYLKPLLLKDGKLIATGYRFYRDEPEQPICNPVNGGFCPSDLALSVSADNGKTWTISRPIKHPYKEMVESSGPCIQLRSGRLMGIGALVPAWDGSNPQGARGVCFTSMDDGSTWDFSFYMEDEEKQIIPFESRLCELADGSVIALCWAYSKRQDKNLNNHYCISRDEGKTWSPPVDTGIAGQASNFLLLEDGRLLTVHSHRADGKGLWVRIVDISDGSWRIQEELCVYGQAPPPTTGPEGNSNIANQFVSLAYGQPSLLRISSHEYLVIHWAVENGQGKILSHRIRIGL